MSGDEMHHFLQTSKTGVLTTLGRDGWPHSAAMWFLPVFDEGKHEVRMWTYAKSQKARNAARDPRASFLAEEGVAYSELRGILVRSKLEILTEFDAVLDIGKKLFERYEGPRTGIPLEGPVLAEIERQASKRVGLVMPLDRVASWDHRKMQQGRTV